MINEFIDTSRYVYNRTLEFIKKGEPVNFFTLRDKLVTQNSKKDNPEIKNIDLELTSLRKKLKLTEDENEKVQINDQINILKYQKKQNNKELKSVKNLLIRDIEIKTPKDIRANSVKQCCDAFKSGMSNLKNGNIKFFNMKYRKKSCYKQGIELTKAQISINNDGKIRILPTLFKDKECILEVNKKMQAKILKNKYTINNNVDLIRLNNKEYYLYLLVPTVIKNKEQIKSKNIAGVDLGVRKFATVYSITTENKSLISKSEKIYEYKHRDDLIKKLNSKLDFIKTLKRVRKKQFLKNEFRLRNTIDNIHWSIINDLVKDNDIIFLGDIKSHNIVKGKRNKRLNRDINDLKLYLFKERLKYKALVNNKTVVMINEAYTTKTCSKCGKINISIGSSTEFNCRICKLQTGRDINASKNILLKGINN